MNNLTLAIRNLLRNRHRTFTTAFTMVIGVVALLLFGGFISSIYFGLQTGIVRSQGHLHIYPKGYLEYGSSRPTDYYIDDYKNIIDVLQDDKFLKDVIKVVTPVVYLSGIAGNYFADTSKTFIANGVVPSEHNKMQQWDSHHLGMAVPSLPLIDDNTEQGVVGLGMARMLNLCESLNTPDCNDRPMVATEEAVDVDILDLQSLVEEEKVEGQDDNENIHIDLLASTGSGAPNVVSLSIVKAQQQGSKVLDDSFVAMHLRQAQRLVFADESRVSAIIVQLKDTDEMEETQARLEGVLGESHDKQRFEVKNYTQFNAEFFQVINMFFIIFSFVALVIALVVLFTTVNTLTMSVMERISEIGSLRAMGLRRSTVRWQFLLEGAVIGIVGATLGLLLAIVLAKVFNRLGFSWIPPGNADSRELKILLFSNPILLIGTWSLMIAVATLSSIIPARFAAKMNIVNAIRNI